MRSEPTNAAGNTTLGVTSVLQSTSVPSSETCHVSYEESRVVLVVVYSAVCLLGLPANCLTAWLTLLQVLQRNVLAVYLFCLSLCELLYISTVPLWIIYIQNQHKWNLGPQACKVEKSFCFEPLRMNSKIAGYHYLRFTFGFAIPLGILAFTNHQIFRSIKLSDSLSAAQKNKVKRSAIAVVTIFLVCFAPYHVVLLVKAASFSFYQGDMDAVCAFESRLYTVSMVFLCLSTVNSVADPIIYVLGTDHSRQEVSRIHTGWKKWSTKTYVTCSKDSEETHLPTELSNTYTFPNPAHPPGSQPAKLGLLCSPERLPEELC